MAIECIPNFSEGRRPEVIEAIAREISSVQGIKLLDKSMDTDHNRAVITFIGGTEPIKKAAFLAAKKAAELIDIKTHQGEHPRIGATDVLPFVPLAGATMGDCIKIAREVGRKIGEELHIPVYLYGEAAQKEENRDLSKLRSNPKNPDFGPSTSGKAGATAVGARNILIAYNINIDADLGTAKEIANKIRESNGGLKQVKAIGISLESKGISQVSMNLTNYKTTPIQAAFEAVKAEAEKRGSKIINSEIIGMVPKDALPETDIKLQGFKESQVLPAKP